ncbi:hypothetical protein LOTGIDRAFT_59597, partial [Lottia gigantea]
VSPNQIKTVIKKLKTSKANGSGPVNNIILKSTIDTICIPLSHLFNFILLKGVFPDSWKLAHVIPLFKKGRRHIRSNYRPISLLNNISKIFEKLVHKHLLSYFTENNLI